MAIDANILLRGIVPDIGAAISGGFQTGQMIRNAPILRKIREQQVAQGEQQQRLTAQDITTGDIELNDKLAMRVFQSTGGNPVTADNFTPITSGLVKGGFGDFFEEEDLIPDAEKIEELEELNRRGAALFQQKQGSQGLASAKTDIYPDGTVVNALPNGTSQVLNPEGNVVEGEERLKVLEKAQQSRIDAARRKAEGTAEGTGAGEEKTTKGQLEIENARLNKMKLQQAQQELKIKSQEAQSAADEAIALIDKLITHPGRKAATGGSSAFPSIPGGQAADFEADFERLKGTAFLEAVQKLKGSGQISNAEGDAATQSVLGVDINQSEAGFVENLKSLKARILEAKKRRSGTYDNKPQESKSESNGTFTTNSGIQFTVE